MLFDQQALLQYQKFELIMFSSLNHIFPFDFIDPFYLPTKVCLKLTKLQESM